MKINPFANLLGKNGDKLTTFFHDLENYFDKHGSTVPRKHRSEFRFGHRPFLYLEFSSSDKLERGSSFLKELQTLLDSGILRKNQPPRLSVKKICEKAFTNWGTERSPFPKSYEILVEQALLFDYFVDNFKLLDWHATEKDKKLKFELSPSERKIELKPTLPGVDQFYRAGKSLQLFEGQLPIQNVGLKEVLTWAAKEINNPKKRFLDVSWDRTENSAVISKAFEGLSRRESQELCYLLSNPHLIIPNLISFFQKDSDKLMDRDYQLFFFYAFMMADNVKEILGESNPQVRDKFVTFIKEQLKKHKALGSIENQLFFLWIAQLASERVPLVANAFPDIKNQYFAVAESCENTEIGKKMKALAYLHFIASMDEEEKWSEEDILRLAKSASYTQAIGFNSERIHSSIVEGMYLILDRLTEEVKKLKPDSQEKLREAICEEVLGQKKVKGAKIDLDTFSILLEGKLVGNLPYQFSTHPLYSEVISEGDYIALSSQHGIYELRDKTTPNKELFRIFFDGNILKIQKSIDNEWHTYLPKDDLSFNPKGLINDHLHWGLAKEEQGKIYIEEQKSGKIVAEVQMIKDQKNMKVQSIKKVAPKEKVHNATLSNIYETSSVGDRLGFFQSLESIFVWENEETKQIEFNSLGIKFTTNDQGLLVYSEDSRFHLAKQQDQPPLLPFFSGYLKLSDQEGKTKYFITRGTIDKKKSASGSLKRRVVIEPDLLDPAFYEFEVINGKLCGKTQEENLYLAYIHLANKNYTEANVLLQQHITGQPKGYSKKETEILKRIHSYIKDSGDNSAESIAVSLKAVYLHIRNLTQPVSEKTLKELQEKAASLLKRFYPLANHVKLLSLSPAQELELLELLPDEINKFPLNQRLAQLLSIEKKRTIKKDVHTFALDLPKSADLKYTEEKILDKINEYNLEAHGEVGFYTFGCKKFLDNIPNILNSLVSEKEEVRKRVIADLSLYTLKDYPELQNLKKLFLFFAGYASKQAIEAFREQLPDLSNEESPIKLFFDVVRKYCQEPQKQTVPQTNISEETIHFKPKQKKVLEPKEFKVTSSYQTPKTSYEGFKKMLPETLISDDNLNKVAQKVTNEIKKLKGDAKSLEHEILKLANQLPANRFAALKQQLKIYGQKKKVLSLDDLIILYLQNNGAALLKANPSLTQPQVSTLTEKLTEYLIKTTESHHLTRIKSFAEDALKNKGVDRKRALEDLRRSLNEERQYDPPADFPVMLTFEHFSHFRLRKAQVETIRSMTIGDVEEKNKPNLITQLIMSSGKSKVILPLLAYKNSKGDNVPFIVVPDQLYETNLEDIRVLSGKLLNQEVETIFMEKGTRLDLAGIEAILRKLKRVMQTRSYCLVSSTTMHNLRLNFKDVCKQLGELSLEEMDEQLIKKYHLLRELLNLIHDKGDAIIDEVDSVLDCTKEVMTSSGRREPITKETIKIFSDIFTLLADDKELCNFLKIDKEYEIPFDKNKFDKEIKPLLVNKLIQHVGWQGLNEKEKEKVRRYLYSEESSKLIENADPKIKKTLAIGKELMKSLLSYTVDNKCDTNFGLSQMSASNYAIPYSQKDTPSEGSIFSSPYETMMYTLLYYTRKGVSSSQLKRLIDHCKAEAYTESETFEIPFHQTQAYKDFSALNLVENKDLFSIHQVDLDDATKNFNLKRSNRIRFAKLFGLTEIEIFSEQIPSDSQALVGMFNTVKGFTGTLWNKNTYHKSLQPEEDTTVDKKTLDILKETQPKTIDFSISEGAQEDFLNTLKDYQACIDVGAWFRGRSATGIAKQILDHLPKNIKGVAFTNDQDLPPGTKGQNVILERGKAHLGPKLLSQSELTPKERFTYYNVTTGIDISQDDFAKALVTIDRTMILRDLLQAVWRLRKLDRDQRVDFAIPKELKDHLEKTKENVNSEVFVDFVKKTQETRQKRDNLRALKQQIAYEFESILERVLCQEDLSYQKAITISKDVKNFLSRQTEQDPYELFGAVETQQSMKTIIKHLINSTLYEIKKIYKNHKEFESVCRFKKLETDINELVKYERLPYNTFPHVISEIICLYSFWDCFFFGFRFKSNQSNKMFLLLYF